MPQLLTIGPRGFHKALASASTTFTPLYDRAAIVRRIFITNPSADDTWIISTQGQEQARYPIYAVGNQQLLGGPSSAVPKLRDIFDFVKEWLGFELIYPVPQGQTITVSSVGGATANITLEYTEHTPGDVTANLLNAPQSTHFVMPVFLVPSATVALTAAGETDFASQITAAWLPQLYGAVQIPAAYRIAILAFFLEGAGVNTYSGAADHQSTSDHLGLVYNGQRMFTRDSGDGIANIGSPSAAGSGNTVYNNRGAPYPAFQTVVEPVQSVLPQPFVLMPGSQAHFYFGTAGDATGNANYAKALHGFLADVQLTGMMPS